jgi:hypothetical protein
LFLPTRTEFGLRPAAN